MSTHEAFATKLPSDLKKTLDLVCQQLGLRKTYVVETALREKLEDLMDAEDLKESISEATGFHSWESVKTERKKRKKR
jgi:predicted DNA-binding protein